MAAATKKPLDRIRRFDVFAEYQNQEHHDDGMPLDQAKGYGLWVAKVVAARTFARERGRESKPSGDKPWPRKMRSFREDWAWRNSTWQLHGGSISMR